MAAVQENAAKARVCDPTEKAAADARMEDRVREVEAVMHGAMGRNSSVLGHHLTLLGMGAPVGVLDRQPTKGSTRGR
jgi:hypothetical protein